MPNNSDRNRKYERFPAYSDKEGVKRKSERKKDLFKSDESWILTNEKEETIFLDSPTFNKQTHPRRVQRYSSNSKDFHSNNKEKKEERILPDYRNKSHIDSFNSFRSPFFDKKIQSQRRKEDSSFRKERLDHLENDDQRIFKKEYNDGRSYFVPKYIPSSLIKEESDWKIDPSLLIKSMKKEPNTFLLLDFQDDYIDKKTNQPSVKRFPSNEHINSHTKEKISGKRSVLERSLAGMIQEEGNQFEPNGYFNQLKK